MKKLLLSLFFVGLSVTAALANSMTPDTITFNWKGPGFFHDAEFLFETPFLSSQLVDIDDTFPRAVFGSLLAPGTMHVDLLLNQAWTTVYTTTTATGGFTYMQDIPTWSVQTPVEVQGIRFTSSPDAFLTGFGGFDSSLRFTFTKAIPTPEPSASLLLGIGLVGLAGYRRWHQKRSQTA